MELENFVRMTTVSVVTGSSSVTLKKRIDPSQLKKLWRDELDLDISAELEGVEDIALYECNDTGVQFFTPATVSGSEALYQQLEKFPWYYMPHKWEYDVAARDLTGASRVLEIGCGRGDFLQRLVSQGKKATGLEINPSAVAAARAQNLDVISADLSSYAAANKGAFDAVCAFQVLEHFSDPRAFLDAAVLLLKPGGRLLVGVPNRQSFLEHIDNPLDLPPHHMLRWSAESFERLAGFFALDVERIRFEPLCAYHVPAYLLAVRNRLARIGLLSGEWFVRPLLFSLRTVLHLGLRRFCTGQTLYVVLRART